MSDDRTLGQLVSDAGRDVKDLVQHEVALLKAELQDDVKAGAVAGGLFGAAGFLGAVGFLLLCVAAALGIDAAGLPAWAGFLIVAAVLVLVAGILALVGKRRIGRISKPERTIATVQGTVATLKAAVSSGPGQRSGVAGGASAAPSSGLGSRGAGSSGGTGAAGTPAGPSTGASAAGT